MIVAVSDLHLGFQLPSGRRFYKKIRELIEEETITNLVLIGDVIDLWRRWPIYAVRENWPIFNKLLELHDKGKIQELHYVIGNHDFTFPQYLKGEYKEYLYREYSGLQNFWRKRHKENDERIHKILAEKFPVGQEKLSLESGGQKYLFIHGHQLEFTPNSWLMPLSVYRMIATSLCKSGDTIGATISMLYHFFEPLINLFKPLQKRQTERAAQNILVSQMRARDPDLKDVDPEVLIEILTYIQQHPQKRRLTYRSDVWRTKAMQYVGLKPDEFLVFGHTHTPFHIRETRVANVGCWLTDCFGYLTIKNGQPKLERTKVPSFPIKFLKNSFYELQRLACSLLGRLSHLSIS